MNAVETAARHDRAVEDVGNILELGHVNLRIPEQYPAMIFYVAGLGLTRDPFLPTSQIDAMWINVGRNQFHLPTRTAQVLRGTIGVVVPNLETAARRLTAIAPRLAGTAFSVAEAGTHLSVRCPWGNAFAVHGPGAQFGSMTLGIPYVEFTVPSGMAGGIGRFYDEIVGAAVRACADGSAPAAEVRLGTSTILRFRETAQPLPAFDGHHIMITVADFSGPHDRLNARGLITVESNQHEYRFEKIVDPATGTLLFELEHEVRSAGHPLFGRHLINRNPELTSGNYQRGQDEWQC